MDSYFNNKKLYYTNLYDTESELFRGKDTKGNFKNPFNASAATSPVNNSGDFTEANAGQYFWTSAQYDVKGIIDLLGGKTNFTTQLNTFFIPKTENSNKFLGQEAVITQYAHGNEPINHILYFYVYSHSPKIGQKYIHKVMNEFLNNT